MSDSCLVKKPIIREPYSFQSSLSRKEALHAPT